MVNIYDKANEFERALRESDEYKASVAASEGLYSDEEANSLYTEFVGKQKELMESSQTGAQPTEEELKELPQGEKLLPIFLKAKKIRNKIFGIKTNR